MVIMMTNVWALSILWVNKCGSYDECWAVSEWSGNYEIAQCITQDFFIYSFKHHFAQWHLLQDFAIIFLTSSQARSPTQSRRSKRTSHWDSITKNAEKWILAIVIKKYTLRKLAGLQAAKSLFTADANGKETKKPVRLWKYSTLFLMTTHVCTETLQRHRWNVYTSKRVLLTFFNSIK